MKRKMLKYDAKMSEVLGELLLRNGIFPDKKKMFGHEVYFLNTYMFCGANEAGIFVHIGKNQKEEALKTSDNVKLFEPLQGMVMKDYLLIEKSICSDQDQLLYWIIKSSEYLQTLPPKKKKKLKIKKVKINKEIS